MPWIGIIKDHKDWEEGYDREYLLFYEALTKWSPDKDRSFRPYATGDPIVYEWFLDLPEKYGELDPTNYLIAKKNGYLKLVQIMQCIWGTILVFWGPCVKRRTSMA